MKTTFPAVQQFHEVITLIDEKFPTLSEQQKAEILKSCFKISAS
jgi:hypothetical protein